MHRDCEPPHGTHVELPGPHVPLVFSDALFCRDAIIIIIIMHDVT